MARRVEQGLAVLVCTAPAAFVGWLSWQYPGGSTTVVCTSRGCVTTGSPDRLGEALTALAIVGCVLLIGLALAALIYAHTRTLSGRLLAAMWALVPVLLVLVVGFAFTWMGSAAFFWGVGMLLAAAAGSVAQVTSRRRLWWQDTAVER